VFEQEFYSATEAAELLGISLEALVRCARDGKIPVCFDHGGRVGLFPTVVDTLHAEAQEQSGSDKRVAIVFGPEDGAISSETGLCRCR